MNRAHTSSQKFTSTACLLAGKGLLRFRLTWTFDGTSLWKLKVVMVQNVISKLGPKNVGRDLVLIYNISNYYHLHVTCSCFTPWLQMLQMECHKHVLQKEGDKYILQLASLPKSPFDSCRWTRCRILSQCNLDPAIFLDEVGYNQWLCHL